MNSVSLFKLMDRAKKQTKMEKMNIPKDNILLKSLEHDSPIQHDTGILSFCDTQFLRVSYSSSPELPNAPHPSPDLSTEFPTTSQIDDQFTSELTKACTYTFCDNAEPSEDTTKGMATVCSCPNLRLLESNPTKSASSPFWDSLKFHHGSTTDMAAVPPSDSYKILRQSQCKYISGKWGNENSSPNSSAFREMKCSFPVGLGSSMSDISLNTSSSDIESIIAHRASDVSDISLTESDNLNSNWDITTSSMLEGRERVDVEFPLDCCQINSPRKPMSPVGQFLSWRKNKPRRKTVSSVGNIYTPENKREDKESKLLLTI